MNAEPRYIHALNTRALTPLYDPLIKWAMREEYFKQQLIEQAEIKPEYVLLDLGCGTGTLAVMIKKNYPDIQIVGLDGDKEVLSIARLKAEQAGLKIQFELGLASKLPFENNTFDCIFSSLVFHHLTTIDKKKALIEAHRVLKHGGKFHFADFGPPKSIYTRFASWLMSYAERVDDNINGMIPGYFLQAGFQNVRETGFMATIFGTLTILQADRI